VWNVPVVTSGPNIRNIKKNKGCWGEEGEKLREGEEKRGGAGAGEGGGGGGGCGCRGGGGEGRQWLSLLRAADWDSPIFFRCPYRKPFHVTETGISSVIYAEGTFLCLGHTHSSTGNGEKESCALMV